MKRVSLCSRTERAGKRYVPSLPLSVLQTSLLLVDGFVSLALVKINHWLHWGVPRRDPSLLPVRSAKISWCLLRRRC